MALKLYIGNKNYSSWSMRPWVLMTQAGIPFEEVVVRFDSFEPDSAFKQRIASVSPTGKVPVLADDARGLVVWDTLAIAEYLAEQFPDKALWPADARTRAIARAVTAEMHAGFGALRTHCTLNVEARLPEVGERVLKEHPAVGDDLRRIVSLWKGLLNQYGGPLLFGGFTVADAFFAPVCSRIVSYGLPVPDDAKGYIERVFALPGVATWITGALAEEDFVAFEEPYRTSR